MDIGLLEKSEHVKPLLVKLYDTHHVYKLAGDNKPEARSELGSIVSDLLDVSVEEREKDLVTDILLALIKQAGSCLRQSLANKLAHSKDVPSRLILNFAYDDIEVAENILKHSPVLDTLDLMYILQSKSKEYWAAIASRKDLPENIIDELSSLNDKRTHSVLASNDSISFSDTALNNIFESAKASDMVARSLIERSDIPKALIKEIYTYVGEQIQGVIRARYGTAAENVVKDAISESISEIVQEEKPNLYLPSNLLMQSEVAKSNIRTEKEGHARRLILNEMFESLKLKQYKLFVAKFSIFMGISAEDSVEILSQKYGHGLAILCRSHGVDRNSFIKIFLLTDAIRSNSYSMKGVTLSRALAYYDKLSVEMSRDLYQKNFLVS